MVSQKRRKKERDLNSKDKIDLPSWRFWEERNEDQEGKNKGNLEPRYLDINQ